ncbi:ribonuclease P protein component [Patescibacteria group bacterium]|nr:ribonuclease P protein component [Patescibacteria group bacterium]MBU1672822.1 ribonuclease P protein component [Patescibacteria group bacterium]MBU1963461.1 ribonuclease P protein component [Patescibacteria group bacterium]
MLASNFRLKQQKDFKKTFSTGKTASSGLFVVKYSKNSARNSRFAVIVSNKVSKKAVLRNKLRRRVKSWLLEQGTNILPGQDVIIIAKHQAAGAEINEIRKNLEKAFVRAKLIKNV